MTTTISGSSGITYPAGGLANTAGSGVGTTDTQTLTNKTLTSPTINSPTIGGTPTMNTSVLTSGTATNTTSGTAILLTGIPSWVKRITIMFSGVTTSAAAEILVQIGSGSVTTTGYQSQSSSFSGAVATTAYSTGFGMRSNSLATNGSMVLTLITSNAWTETNLMGWGAAANLNAGAGASPSLSGALDRINITTVAGTATFTAGVVNILYE